MVAGAMARRTPARTLEVRMAGDWFSEDVEVKRVEGKDDTEAGLLVTER
jgi:hypothetical protein